MLAGWGFGVGEEGAKGGEAGDQDCFLEMYESFLVLRRMMVVGKAIRTHCLLHRAPHVQPGLIWQLAETAHRHDADDGENHDEYGDGENCSQGKFLTKIDFYFPEHVDWHDDDCHTWLVGFLRSLETEANSVRQ